MRVGRIHVMTSGSSSTVATDTTETEIASDSRVAVDVTDGDRGETRVATFDGSAKASTGDYSEAAWRLRRSFDEILKIPKPMIHKPSIQTTADRMRPE